MKTLLINMMTLHNAMVALEDAKQEWHEDRDTTKSQLQEINKQLEPFIKAVELAEFEAKLIFDRLVQNYLDEQARNASYD